MPLLTIQSRAILQIWGLALQWRHMSDMMSTITGNPTVFQQLVQDNSKENIKTPYYWPFVSKSKSKKTLFEVKQWKQYNISSHIKWVLIADKSMHIIKVNKNICIISFVRS